MISILFTIAFLAVFVFVGMKYVDPALDRVKAHAQRVIVHYSSPAHWTLLALMASLALDAWLTYSLREHKIIVFLGIWACMGILWRTMVALNEIRGNQAES